LEAVLEIPPVDLGGPVGSLFEPFPEAALHRSIIDRFVTIAARHAGRLAVSDGTRSLSYADLSNQVSRIAAAIAEATVDRPGQIAILLRNEARYSAAMLGVLASGRAFVPLNADHPAERNRLIVTHSGAIAILSAADLAATARAIFPDDVLVLDLEEREGRSPLPSVVQARPDDLAYIAYTSGSTGRPKGVQRHQRSLLHYVLQTANAMQLGSLDRLVSFNSPSLTEGLIITFCALLNGASVHCLPPVDLAPADLAERLRAWRITVTWSVPRLFRHLVEALPPGERFDALRLVSLAGDRVDWADVATARRGCAEGVRIRVGFGSTEAGVHAQWFVDEALRGTSVRLPVGRAPSDQRLMILDDRGEPVADGEVGEVVVTSRSVALGYWRDLEATTRAFATDPAEPATRSFKTGDLALRRPDGLIEYIGRKDQQIKLSGQRIELGEVESALASCRGVRDAAVVVRQNESGVPRSLAAYCEAEPAVAGLSPRHLSALLAEVLPQFMVPGSITIIPELPRLANFKIDREALRQRDQLEREDKLAVPPLTPTEKRLAELWAEAFEATEIGRDDDFFELGGDSLAAATISIGVQDAFGRETDLDMFTDYPTLAEMAAAIDAAGAGGTMPALDLVSRTRPLPLSPIQDADPREQDAAVRDYGRFAALLEAAYASDQALALALGNHTQWAGGCHLLWEAGRIDLVEYSARLLHAFFPEQTYIESLVAFFDSVPRHWPAPLPFEDDPAAEIQIVRNRASDTLLMCFCARNGTLGLPLNFIHQWLGRLPVNLMYIKDFRHMSGGCGYPSLGANRAAAIAAFQRIAGELRCQRIYTFGVSLGGYSALYYGLRLNAVAVFNLAGSTDFTPSFVDSLGPVSREHLDLRRMAPDYLRNMRQLYASQQFRPRVLNVYSISMPRDRLQAEQMAGLNGVELVGVDGGVLHNVIEPLIRARQLMPLLRRFIEATRLADSVRTPASAENCMPSK
jgi:amino acid adenylation domain-containing protein